MSPHLFACLLSALGQITVDELIAEHEATMARIKALSVESDTYQVEGGRFEHTYHQSAARDATRCRSRFEFPVTRLPDGRKRGLICGDLLGDSRGIRSLINWDQRTGKRAADSDGVRADIQAGGPKGHPWLAEPTAMLLQRVQISGGGDVADYVRRGSAVKVLPAIRENGRLLVPVSLNHPSFGMAAPGVGIVSTLYFAPDCGGLILKQVHDVPKGFGFTTPVRIEATVTQLQRTEDGSLLPASIRFVTTETGSIPPIQYEFIQKIVTLQINEEVPASAFDFHFPDGIVVKDRTQPGGIVMHRWGPYDAPAESWVNEPPLWAYVLFAAEDGLSSRVLSAVGLFTAFLSITAWYVIRRQRRKQQSAVTS